MVVDLLTGVRIDASLLMVETCSQCSHCVSLLSTQETRQAMDFDNRFRREYLSFSSRLVQFRCQAASCH